MRVKEWKETVLAKIDLKIFFNLNLFFSKYENVFMEIFNPEVSVLSFHELMCQSQKGYSGDFLGDCYVRFTSSFIITVDYL